MSVNLGTNIDNSFIELEKNVSLKNIYQCISLGVW